MAHVLKEKKWGLKLFLSDLKLIGVLYTYNTKEIRRHQFCVIYSIICTFKCNFHFKPPPQGGISVSYMI